MNDVELPGNHSTLTLQRLRGKPWDTGPATGEARRQAARTISETCTNLEQGEHRHVAQAFDEALGLLQTHAGRAGLLHGMRRSRAVQKCDLPDAWGACDAERLYLDRLLLNPENRTELLRTLLFLSAGESAEAEGHDERFAVETTHRLRLPVPERRGGTVAEIIAASRPRWREEPALALLERIPAGLFDELLHALAPSLYRHHLLLSDLRRKQLDLLPRLARLPGYHFDLARETLHRLFDEQHAPIDPAQLAAGLGTLLLPELAQRVAEALVWDLQINRQTVQALLPGMDSADRLREVTRSLVEEQRGAEGMVQFETIEAMIRTWHRRLAEYAEGYTRLHARVDDARQLATSLLESAGRARASDEEGSGASLARAVHWLFPRVYRIPRLKRLDRPLLVLLAGISGSGSRFVAKQVSQALSIGTFFTTNQVREAIRSTFRWTYGQETAEELYPELFCSGLEPTGMDTPDQPPDDLASFYVQAQLTLRGLDGALARLARENTSAIVEGVHIVPGMLEEVHYERANIVSLVLGHSETLELLPAAVREHPERMQRRHRLSRRIHEHVEELALGAEITVVHDPGRFEATLGEILHRVRDTVADRFVPGAHPLLRDTRDTLEARRQGVCRKPINPDPPPLESLEFPPDDATLAHLDGHLGTLADADSPPPQRLAAAAALKRILTRVHAPVALAFDMGGVLVRGHNAIFTRHYAEEQLGIPLDEEQLARIHYRVFKVDDAPYRRLTRGEAQPRDFARHFLEEIFLCRQEPAGQDPGSDDPVAQRAILQAYYDHYEEIADNTRVIGQLDDLGIAVYGLTNNFLEKVASIQARIPLIRHLPMVISEVARARKPQRRIFQYLVRLLQLTRGMRSEQADRILFFDDKQKNLDGAYRHFGFYGINYDANRGERLAETPEIREILDQTRLRETCRLVRSLVDTPHAHGVTEELATALDELAGYLTRLQRDQAPVTAPTQHPTQPDQGKMRGRLRALGLRDPNEQTPIVEFALGEASRAFLARHRERLLRTRESLVALRTLQFQTLSHMVNVPDGDYDPARRELARVVPHIDEYTSPAEVESRFLRALFSELKWFLADYLAERDLVEHGTLERCLGDIGDYAAFKAHQREGFRQLFGDRSPDEATLQRIDLAVQHIEEGVADTARKYRHLWARWYVDELNEMVALMEDDSVRHLIRRLSPHDWHLFVRWFLVRVSNIPHIKNLSKPTVVLITGTSGTGKSSVARHIARSLSIPIHFSTDVVGREVVRSTLDFLLGPNTARRELPELYGSSFSPAQDWQQARPDAGDPLLDWYYGHAQLSMIGVRGILDRLLATDNSAVIEGVPLVPGFLPEHYFERLNIVWVVATIEERETHFQRYAGRDAAGVERGGAARYRQRFEEIRRIHDRLKQLGQQGGCTVVDNTYGLGQTAELALDRIENFFAVRGLPVADAVRERVRDDIETRRRHIWSERLLGRRGFEEPDPETGAPVND